MAERGEFKVGVRTVDLVHKDQIDILNYEKDSESLYDRPLKIEVWYPAELDKSVEPHIQYEEVMGNANSDDRPLIPFTFSGRAVRDAEPHRNEDSYPLVIVSHG